MEFPPLLRTAMALALVGLGPRAATAQVEAQVFLGSAASLPLPITVTQAGEADIHFTAKWATRPRNPTWYYAWRVGLWRGNRGWRLDHTHHKLYLKNPPATIEALRITNGFNIVTVSRAFRQAKLSYSLGAGPVVTYPISVIRGKHFDHESGWYGYFISGGSLMAMATREFPIAGRLALNIDARGSASYVRIPVVDGHASVPNLALHLHTGIGYRLGKAGRSQ